LTKTKPQTGTEGASPADAGRAAGSPASFPIVGVGASAGGLEAFRRLLGALPSNTGMAYVLVQHLDPNHESILAELLSEVTQMEVAEVKGDVRVQPNQVYVIPPSKGLIFEDGLLKLVPRVPPGTAHMPIDSFFKTLADVHGRQGIGIVLSGMGSDGTLGLQAIEAADGIAFAQEPTSAQYDSMPRSAIQAGGIDFVLSPEDIASELKRLGQHPYIVGGSMAPSGPELTDASAEEEGNEDGEGLARILEQLRATGGTDFSAYKKTTLRRRIARRMAVTRVETLLEYARYLEGNATEATALYQDCLISVTSFFRDPEVFEVLSEQIFSTLLQDRPSDAPLRVWVPGCATGEEAYSIAMCLLERMAKLSRNPTLQIFATDLSEGALAKAREGKYLVNIARDVSAERLQRFFTKVGDCYQISKGIREMCVFARHDLTRDPPYSRLDLISCRNVLIYLEPRLQDVVFATFHYALKPDGFLLVGPAETVGTSGPLFTAVDEKRRIYSRNAVDGPPRLLSVLGTRNRSRTGSQQPSPKPAISEVPREVDRMLLSRFGPPAVVVDEGLRVLEFRGDTSPFLDHGHGKATLSLERLVRKGLLMELRQAIADARRSDAAVRKAGLQVHHRQNLQSVNIEVVPIKGRAAAERCLLVLFETAGTSPLAEPSTPAAFEATGDARDVELERLGQGLAQTTEYVHTLVREHESALEELQSTTEEALSSNEELQSLNEELQTAKEEIQSANEELATLNQELQDRNAQLGRSNEDIQRGLDSANELVDTVPGPLVILDSQLRIEKGNVAFYEIFKTKADFARGRGLGELGERAWGKPELSQALRGVLEGATLEDLQLEVSLPGIGSRAISLRARRLHPDRDATGRLLVAIEDHTEVKRAEQGREDLLKLEHAARTRAEASDHLKNEFVATASHELRGPLTVISGWMNVLVAAGTDVEPATLAKALAAIGRGVAAQGRLISDLLDHSSMVAGKLELRRAPIDLFAVAEAALVGVRAAAAAKDIDVQLKRDSSPCVVLGDFDRMQQIFWNLFLNAVKFTPPGGAVYISLARVANEMHLSVRDTGCGISPEFLPHVFDRFRQAEGSSARAQPGLGLGLTLVQELVELHGGRVCAESAGVNQGSTFTLHLPIPALLMQPEPVVVVPPSAPGKAETIPPPPVEPASSPRHEMLHGTRLLVVDDEVDARDALVALLERYGAEVRSAATVAEAIAALKASLPDVLISDIGMPGSDGYELIRHVRRLPADAGGRLPSLAVSGYATDAHRKKVLSTGFHGLLEKPVAAADLVAEVVRLAGRGASVATT
jgi:two-component system, chemotaxis family, CheB/CheR fusion protein